MNDEINFLVCFFLYYYMPCFLIYNYQPTFYGTSNVCILNSLIGELRHHPVLLYFRHIHLLTSNLAARLIDYRPWFANTRFGLCPCVLFHYLIIGKDRFTMCTNKRHMNLLETDGKHIETPPHLFLSIIDWIWQQSRHKIVNGYKHIINVKFFTKYFGWIKVFFC